MSYTKKTATFRSHDGEHDIAYYVYTPSEPALGVVQIVHGMCEFLERYEHFIEFLTDKGFVVCGEDHLGHGSSVSSDDDFGYFGAKGGVENLVEDVEMLRTIMRRRYRALPYFLLGHSMGSFISREYITFHRDTLDGLILIGTSGQTKAVKAGVRLSSLVAKLRGDRYRSKMIRAIAFGSYVKHFESEKDISAWLTRDREVRHKYHEDKRCKFNFTAAGYRDMFTMLLDINSEEWALNFPKGLPVFILSGSDDPVGEYGQGVQAVADRLQDAEIYELSYRLYDGMRHEILNEIGRESVYEDILAWLLRIREGVVEDRMGLPSYFAPGE